MKYCNRKPNMFLQRVAFYEDATLGELRKDDGELLCYTMEPTWRGKDERKIIGKTAIDEGTYQLTEDFDSVLKYKNLKLGAVRGMKNVRLCFVTKECATPGQTRGNILLGMGIDKTNGRLIDCIGAFRCLHDYYVSKRCNHQQLCLRVSNGGLCQRMSDNFSKVEMEVNSVDLEDFELQTY